MPPPLFVITKQKINNKIIIVVKSVEPYDYYPYYTEWILVYNPTWYIYINGIRVR